MYRSNSLRHLLDLHLLDLHLLGRHLLGRHLLGRPDRHRRLLLALPSRKLEKQTGHEKNGGDSKVDLNRAGTPLIEIVTHPDLRSGEEVYEYLTELKANMRYVGVSECDMEKGELRCDVNISVRPKGREELGTKVEIKNLNSFKFARSALEYEFERQVEEIKKGGTIVQETRLYDADRVKTIPMRSKEEAHDYRYFLEPDLPPIVITKDWEARIRKEVPELPRPRLQRFQKEYGLSEDHAAVLTAQRELADYFEACAKLHDKPKKVANWVRNDLMKIAGTTAEVVVTESAGQINLLDEFTIAIQNPR